MTKTGQRVQLSKSIRWHLLASMLAATGMTGLWGCGDDDSPGDDADAGADAGKLDSGPSSDAPETDFEPPTALIVFPPPQSVTDAVTITVRGTAGDATAVTAVTVNGTAATSDDGFATWTAEIPLTEGDNPIVVTTEDTLGNGADSVAQATVVRTTEIVPSASAVTWDRVTDRAVVLDTDNRALFTLDPQTRKRTLLSDGSVGTPALRSPVAVSWDLQNERILVVDSGVDPEGDPENPPPPAPALIAVDPVTGLRSVLSDASLGNGPPLEGPTGVTWDQRNNQALVLDGVPPSQRLVAIAANGDRDVIIALGPTIMVAVSLTWDEQLDRALVLDGFGRGLYAVGIDDRTMDLLSGGGDGGANEFSLPMSVTWDPVHNEAIVTDLGLDALLAVNTQTGTRVVLASPSVGTGAAPRSPVAATWDYAANRLLVVDSELGSVLAMLADTGDAVVLSDAFQGMGPALRAPTALSWDTENNRALIADATLRGVMAIDPATGSRTVLTSPARGTGNQLIAPVALTWDESMDRVLVVDANPGVLVSIDPATGQRRVLSDGTDGVQPDLSAPRAVTWDSYNSRAVVANDQELVSIEVETGRRSIASRQGILGEGPGFMAPRAVAVWTSEPGNDVVFVADAAQDALFYVDIDVETSTAGNRALLSNQTTGTGPNFGRPIAVGWDPAREQALVIDAELVALVGVDVTSGNRTILSSADVGKGPPILAPTAVVWDPTSTRVLVLDAQLRAVLAVDPVTGERVILAR
jgi:Glucodextranase, domain B